MWTILFDKEILTASEVLAIIGSTIKYRTGKSNELIALVLTVISTAIGLARSCSSGLLSAIAREKGEVVQHLPMVGDVRFSSSDIDSLRRCIIG